MKDRGRFITQRFAAVLISTLALAFIFYETRQVLAPLLVAVVLSILLLITLVGAIEYFFISQTNKLRHNMPGISEKAIEMINKTV